MKIKIDLIWYEGRRNLLYQDFVFQKNTGDRMKWKNNDAIRRMVSKCLARKIEIHKGRTDKPKNEYFIDFETF